MTRGGWIRSLMPTALQLVSQARDVVGDLRGRIALEFAGFVRTRIGKVVGQRGELRHQGSRVRDVEGFEDQFETPLDVEYCLTTVPLGHAPDGLRMCPECLLRDVMPPLRFGLLLLRQVAVGKEPALHVACNAQRNIVEQACHEIGSQVAFPGAGNADHGEGLIARR